MTTLVRYDCPACLEVREVRATECVVNIHGTGQYVSMRCPDCLCRIEKDVTDETADALRAAGAIGMSVAISEGECEAFASDLAALSDGADLVSLMTREQTT